ncbi:MAG: glycosyltransferase family 4 protein [Terricaulis sp.]
MSRPKLLFLATEDWFVRSHFAPLVNRAQSDGFDVVVAARRSGADLGVRVVDMPFARGSVRLQDLWREVGALKAILAAEKPDIVHVLSLKPILNCMLAAGRTPQAYALTGRGYLAVSKKPWTKAILAFLAPAMRRAIAKGNTVLVVENEVDRRWVEGRAPLPNDRVFLMPGAGVDPSIFKVSPEPEGAVTIGVVTRLVRSKGVDVLVEAARELKRSGLDVVLRIAGAIDPLNPESVTERELATWSREPWIDIVGHVEDVPGFWATTHIAALASRGGEGLPRSLLEAASSGRAIVTTDVPGCGDFVRDGVTGYVVPTDDVSTTASRLRALVEDSALRRRMGAAGREMILASYTEAHAAACAARAWERLMQFRRA